MILCYFDEKYPAIKSNCVIFSMSQANNLIWIWLLQIFGSIFIKTEMVDIYGQAYETCWFKSDGNGM